METGCIIEREKGKFQIPKKKKIGCFFTLTSECLYIFSENDTRKPIQVFNHCQCYYSMISEEILGINFKDVKWILTAGKESIIRIITFSPEKSFSPLNNSDSEMNNQENQNFLSENEALNSFRSLDSPFINRDFQRKLTDIQSKYQNGSFEFMLSFIEICFLAISNHFYEEEILENVLQSEQDFTSAHIFIQKIIDRVYEEDWKTHLMAITEKIQECFILFLSDLSFLN